MFRHRFSGFVFALFLCSSLLELVSEAVADNSVDLPFSYQLIVYSPDKSGRYNIPMKPVMPKMRDSIHLSAEHTSPKTVVRLADLPPAPIELAGKTVLKTMTQEIEGQTPLTFDVGIYLIKSSGKYVVQVEWRNSGSIESASIVLSHTFSLGRSPIELRHSQFVPICPGCASAVIPTIKLEFPKVP